MKKYALDLSIFILVFLFMIFGISNLGFLFNLSINPFYLLISLLISSFYLFKSTNFIKKISIILAVFLISLILSNAFIDTSFDGRCYHFTLENLFKLGFNPIYMDIKKFAFENNNYYNLLFASSYPNALEITRANFYLFFNNMESSKIVNFLLMFLSFFYSFYFFLNKTSKIKALLLSFIVLLNAVLICQINTKMVDFSLYCVFVLQIFSIMLIDKKKDLRLNYLVFILSCVFSNCIKYTGLLNTFIIISFYLCYKFLKKEKIKLFLKSTLVVFILTLFLGIQPYITNVVNFKNPFYPSIGYNKLDYMTKQNPKEFKDRNYFYKFFRSMFSSTSDSRMGNIETPKLYYKIPFTNHFDLPYFSEDIRINGFGHLFSGIFVLSILSLLYFLRKKKGILPFFIILLTTFLNPICWWARFVPQLHLLPCFCAYYFKKKNAIFYIFILLLLINGLWVMKENLAVNAYKTYIMHKFYDDLYYESQNKKVLIYFDKKENPEDDSTILYRMKEYGIEYEIVEKCDKSFEQIKTDSTISDAYKMKLVSQD